MMASRSRWLVGSSSNSRSDGHISACARLSRMRQPPEKLATGSSISPAAKPRPVRRRSARERAVYRPASASAACSSPISAPRSSASAAASLASSERKAPSPSMAYSTAGRSSASASCATCATRHCAGKSSSPLSVCSSPRSRANRLDLPEPFAPMRPMRSPGLSATSAPSSRSLVPRMRLTCEKRIMAILPNCKAGQLCATIKAFTLPEVPMMKGKTALVTGSTSGIGLGIAEALAKQGANIVLNGFGERSEIERLRARLAEKHHIDVQYDAADMSKPDAIEAMLKSALGRFGAVDILVNNAGIQHVAPVEKWNAIIAINLSAAFHTTRLALPAMKKKGWGRIVNIASAHALVASPFKAAYVSAKHGLAGLTKTVALEAAEHGITVNAICPGYVLTPLVEKQIPDQAKARGISEEAVKRDVLLAAQPTKKFVGVEEIAGLAAYLCAEQAASMTGA